MVHRSLIHSGTSNATPRFSTAAVQGFIVRDLRGADGLKYRIQVSVKDCTGCGLCVEACPAKGKALVMKPYEEEKEQAMNHAQ
jgi:pyruvate-ferredoxin/flavodoxin oxidoreductase